MPRFASSFFLGSAFLSLVACGAASEGTDESIASSTQSVSLGEKDLGDPAVGLLLSHSGDQIHQACTGTLIANNVVLTAGHCFDESVMDSFFVGQANPVADRGAWTESVTAGMRAFEIDEFSRPSDYLVSDMLPKNDEDLALVHLRCPVQDVTPVPVASAPPPVGASAKVVGYGRHPTGESSYLTFEKRSAPISIDAHYPRMLFQGVVSQGVPLPGDSGGPLLYLEHLVGVVSSGQYASDPNMQVNQYYGRADTQLAWVQKFIADHVAQSGSCDAAEPSPPSQARVVDPDPPYCSVTPRSAAGSKGGWSALALSGCAALFVRRRRRG